MVDDRKDFQVDGPCFNKVSSVCSWCPCEAGTTFSCVIREKSEAREREQQCVSKTIKKNLINPVTVSAGI